MGEITNMENTEHKKDKKLRKKITIILCFIIAVLMVGITLYVNYPFTEDQKDSKIAETYLTVGTDEAIKLSIKYYGDSDKALEWIQTFSNVESKNVIRKLTKVDQNLKKDGNYFDYDLTLKNESDKTITYIKYNIYLMDESDNIIHSDWSNWSGRLLPDAQVKMDTMIDYVPNVKSFRYEIENITIE